MDFSSTAMRAFSTLWYLIPLVLLAAVVLPAILTSPWFKGAMGEFVVNFYAKWLLDKRQYHLVKNVTLPTEDGTTQIDHIIVSVFGIFVIETKNMKGRIYGDPKQRTWTQKIYKYSNGFQNPLRQNYKHIQVLKSLLGLNKQQIHSVIVFVGDSTFRTEMPENVTYGRGCIRFIKSKKKTVLSEEKVKEILEKIESGRLVPSFRTNRAHRKHVKSIVAKKEKEITPSCLKCGSSMVLREAGKGRNVGKKFWGCTKFPQCRGTKNIT
ncbi:MAG: NERD domain-containing protein [Candidatus Electrothrix sp. YB6]